MQTPETPEPTQRESPQTEPPKEAFVRRLGRWFELANPFLVVLATVVVVGSAYLTLVEWRVGTLVNDPAFVTRVADQIRQPSLVFDSEGTIVDDKGALELLAEPPEFVPEGEGGEPPSIVITPNVHLAAPPLVQILDSYPWDFRAERGKGLQWVFRGVSHEGGFVEGARSPNPRFRLEIIR